MGEEKNEGNLDGLEENGVGGVGDVKIVEWNRQHYLMCRYDCMNAVNLHCVQPWKVVPHLCTMNQNTIFKN